MSTAPLVIDRAPIKPLFETFELHFQQVKQRRFARVLLNAASSASVEAGTEPLDSF